MPEDRPLKKVMNGRALTSLVLLVSLVWLAPSGLLMHAAEHGGSEQWGHAMVAIHNTAAVIFTVSALVHLGYNWKALARPAIMPASIPRQGVHYGSTDH